MASNNPLNLVVKSVGQRVYVKCRNGRSITGVLHAYDDHLNLLISQAEETGPELAEARKIPILYTRGDLVMAISPLGKRQMTSKNIRDELQKEMLS